MLSREATRGDADPRALRSLDQASGCLRQPTYARMAVQHAKDAQPHCKTIPVNRRGSTQNRTHHGEICDVVMMSIKLCAANKQRSSSMLAFANEPYKHTTNIIPLSRHASLHITRTTLQRARRTRTLHAVDSLHATRASKPLHLWCIAPTRRPSLVVHSSVHGHVVRVRILNGRAGGTHVRTSLSQVRTAAELSVRASGRLLHAHLLHLTLAHHLCISSGILRIRSHAVRLLLLSLSIRV